MRGPRIGDGVFTINDSKTNTSGFRLTRRADQALGFRFLLKQLRLGEHTGPVSLIKQLARGAVPKARTWRFHGDEGPNLHSATG